MLQWSIHALQWATGVLQWSTDVLQWSVDVLEWSVDAIQWYIDHSRAVVLKLFTLSTNSENMCLSKYHHVKIPLTHHTS